ncbi:MAG TPA: DUF1326 domain-containing protein [Terriglobia bacterium]|nr:DUF1326 domain-containing protein [Terriglobia bacterium]
MRKTFGVTLGAVCLLAFSAGLSAAAVTGDYIEVRSADVYTGPCFANSEVDLEGKQAILAWKVRQGNWQGTDLAGLSVVAVVDASATLGDPYHSPFPASAVLIVDGRANPAQRHALEALVRFQAGKLVGHVVRVETAPIELNVGEGGNHGSASLQAGRLVQVRTRSLCAADHICGNEELYYPPLVKTSHAMPAFTLEDTFQGHGLGMMWTRAQTRSAFVGSFSL